MNIAFVGLGAMGRPMAQHLMDAGHHLRLFARNREDFDGKLSTLISAGASAHHSIPSAVADCDALIINVTSTEDVLDVITAAAGSLPPHALVIDHSTITPEGARNAAKHHPRFVDAPVSGGEAKAISGELVSMVGGDASDVAAAWQLMQAYVKSHVHLGPVGAGQVAKLCNQIAQVINIQGIAEAMKFAELQGVDQHAVLEAIRGGMAGSQMLDLMGPKIAARDFTAGIQARLHAKDFGLAASVMGADAGPALRATQGQLEQLMSQGLGTQDTSVLYQLLEGHADGQ
ncbi:MAG: NAD(P)-dependent oxidoreductase [Litorivicinus sp.]